MRKLRSLTICILAAQGALPAADSNYRVTYDGGSVAAVSPGTELRMYFDGQSAGKVAANPVNTAQIRVLRNKLPVATISAMSVDEVSYGQDAEHRVAAGMGVDFKYFCASSDLASRKRSKSTEIKIGLTWTDGARKNGVVLSADRSVLTAIEAISGKKAINSESEPLTPPEILAMPQEPGAYRHRYEMREIAVTNLIQEQSDTDALIEATCDPRVFKFTGKTEWIEGRSINWEKGARHTVKGKIDIAEYTIISDPKDPLVFRLVLGKGYVYEKGRGIVITPFGERIFLSAGS